MIRVVVAEDSITFRRLLVEMLSADSEVRVIGEATNGMEAVELTKTLQPDVVTMDIRMPVMDGFQATKRIMIEAPTPIVIVSGSVSAHDLTFSMNALRAGALTLLPKPPGPGAPDFDEIRRRFVETVKAMSQVKVVRHWPERALPGPGAVQAGLTEARRVRVAAIAASTGGPSALHHLISRLPGDLDLPILVVQHLAAEFVSGLAEWLDSASDLKVKVAVQGERLTPGTVYLAPDGVHLGVSETHRILLTSEPPREGFRPSATALFQSVARRFGASAAAIILTGMGRDGAEGLRAVHEAGGYVIAQDEASSVVFGMPGAAIAAGYANCVLPLSAIPGHFLGLLQRERAKP